MQNTNLKTILITGSNKGLGFGIVKSLLEKQMSSKEWKYLIILTSRDEKRGLEAISKLNKLFGDLTNNLIYKTLDIESEVSIDTCIDWLISKFGQIDILVNNAGIEYKGKDFDKNVFDSTFAVNFFGTIYLTEKILDNFLIRENGKIIIVTSSLGNITKLGENLQRELKKENMEKNELIEYAYKFRNAIEKCTFEYEGWINNCYAVSKMLLNKYTFIISKREKVINKGIQVYSCTPGWVKTDMAPEAIRTVEEGVICPIYLIELEYVLNQEIQGKFFYNSEVLYIGI